MEEIGKDFDTIWGGILFTIVLGLYIYLLFKVGINNPWLVPLGMFVLPLIIYPLCDVIGSIIQDFIDKF